MGLAPPGDASLWGALSKTLFFVPGYLRRQIPWTNPALYTCRRLLLDAPSAAHRLRAEIDHLQTHMDRALRCGRCTAALVGVHWGWGGKGKVSIGGGWGRGSIFVLAHASKAGRLIAGDEGS
eukprot:1136641-Pelagomonas_calceolata.AAC.4